MSKKILDPTTTANNTIKRISAMSDKQIDELKQSVKLLQSAKEDNETAIEALTMENRAHDASIAFAKKLVGKLSAITQ